MRVKTSPLFEIARVLVRLNHVASIIAKRESQRHVTAEKFRVADSHC
jgi:hypothetical protein